MESLGFGFTLSLYLYRLPCRMMILISLMKKIRDGVAENPNIDKALELYDDVQGCFIDIDYVRRDRTNWMPLIHVDRLYDFVFAYTIQSNFYYQNEDLYHKIVKGLEYWHHRNPHCNNWWYNQIAEPQKLGILLIQMRVGKRQIPEVLETKVLATYAEGRRTSCQMDWSQPDGYCFTLDL